MMLFVLLANLWVMDSFILLDYKKPIRMNTGTPRALLRNGLVIADDQTLLFFDMEGRFVKQIGKSGQGPGELQHISEFVVGKSDWVGILDGASQFFSLFERESGEFQRRVASRALTMVANHENDSFFFLQIERTRLDAQVNSNVSLADYPFPILRRVQLKDLDKWDQEGAHELFHLASNLITRWDFNDRRHWVREIGNTYLVLDELTARISAYSVDSPDLIDAKNLRLPGFVEAPEQFADVPRMSSEEYRNWWYSFSRFLDFNVAKNRRSVVYLVPDLGQESVYRYRIASLDRDLKIINIDQELGHYQSGQYYLGSNENYYAFVADISEGLFPTYQVTLKSWGL